MFKKSNLTINILVWLTTISIVVFSILLIIATANNLVFETANLTEEIAIYTFSLVALGTSTFFVLNHWNKNLKHKENFIMWKLQGDELKSLESKKAILIELLESNEYKDAHLNIQYLQDNPYLKDKYDEKIEIEKDLAAINEGIRYLANQEPRTSYDLINKGKDSFIKLIWLKILSFFHWIKLYFHNLSLNRKNEYVIYNKGIVNCKESYLARLILGDSIFEEKNLNWKNKDNLKWHEHAFNAGFILNRKEKSIIIYINEKSKYDKDNFYNSDNFKSVIADKKSKIWAVEFKSNLSKNKISFGKSTCKLSLYLNTFRANDNGNPYSLEKELILLNERKSSVYKNWVKIEKLIHKAKKLTRKDFFGYLEKSSQGDHFPLYNNFVWVMDDKERKEYYKNILSNYSNPNLEKLNYESELEAFTIIASEKYISPFQLDEFLVEEKKIYEEIIREYPLNENDYDDIFNRFKLKNPNHNCKDFLDRILTSISFYRKNGNQFELHHYDKNEFIIRTLK